MALAQCCDVEFSGIILEYSSCAYVHAGDALVCEAHAGCSSAVLLARCEGYESSRSVQNTINLPRQVGEHDGLWLNV